MRRDELPPFIKPSDAEAAVEWADYQLELRHRAARRLPRRRLTLGFSKLTGSVIPAQQPAGRRDPVQLRPLERAAFFTGYAEKKFKHIIQGASGAFGNAATRLEAFVVAGGMYVDGNYPDLDGLFREQASEVDHKRRAAILHKIQQLLYERTVYAPIWQLAFINGVGPRVGESGLGRRGPRLLGALRGRHVEREVGIGRDQGPPISAEPPASLRP